MEVLMTSYIEIRGQDGNLKFKFSNQVHSIEVVSSWKALTQTAVVRLPRFKRLLTNEDEQYKIVTGDAITISCGYNGNLVKEFEGYVSDISPITPLKLKCEDEMWKLKQQTVNMS